MSQNVYDRDDFFEEYSKLPRSQQGLDGALEWPVLKDLVGDVSNQCILDLGCGYGWFCRWACNAGAKKVHGVDVSSKMLEKAREFTSDDAVLTYAIEDLEVISLPEEQYDLVYSALAFHYVKDLSRLFREVHGSLVSGGRFVFSVEHPTFTAPKDTPKFRTSDGREDEYI